MGGAASTTSAKESNAQVAVAIVGVGDPTSTLRVELDLTPAQLRFQELDPYSSGLLSNENAKLMVEWLLAKQLVKYECEITELVQQRANILFKFDPYRFFTFEELNYFVEEELIREKLKSRCELHFRSMDMNGSGLLERHEVQQLLDSMLDCYQSYGCDEEKRKIIHSVFLTKLDSSPDSSINLSEFELLLDDVCSELNLVQKVQAKFKELDANGNGLLDSPEIIGLAEWILKVYHPRGVVLTQVERIDMKNRILRRCNVGRGGTIGLAEVASLLSEVIAVSSSILNIAIVYNESFKGA